MASCCAESCSLALFAFSAAPGLASPSSFPPCPRIPGHRLPCTTCRCEAGGSFLHIPEVSAAVAKNENSNTDFSLLFILPLNSVQPPCIYCATPSNTPSRFLPERWCIPPTPWGHDVRLPAHSGNQDLPQGAASPSLLPGLRTHSISPHHLEHSAADSAATKPSSNLHSSAATAVL